MFGAIRFRLVLPNDKFAFSVATLRVITLAVPLVVAYATVFAPYGLKSIWSLRYRIVPLLVANVGISCVRILSTGRVADTSSVG